MSIDPELIAAMNRWRLAQSPVQSPARAILSLIEIGLAAEAQRNRALAAHERDDELEDLIDALRKATDAPMKP